MSRDAREKHDALGVIEIAGVTHARHDMTVCGDAFGWLVTDKRLTIVLADGLGHGDEARVAADKAVECALASVHHPLDVILKRCHDALGRTRGAAVAVAQIVDSLELAFCGVGNVAIREAPRRGGRGTSIPGIVGMRLPSLRVFHSRLHPDDLLCIHTDGIDARFDLVAAASTPTLIEMTRSLHERWALAHDDATVISLRVRKPEPAEPRDP